jgi:hypothetical protein
MKCQRVKIVPAPRIAFGRFQCGSAGCWFGPTILGLTVHADSLCDWLTPALRAVELQYYTKLMLYGRNGSFQLVNQGRFVMLVER